MAKNINVNLTFTANTKQAQQGLNALQTQLHNLSTNALNITGASQYTKEIMRATNAASNLSSMLQVATNPETGTLNLNKFSQVIKSSGKDLSFYRDQLLSLGSTGEQAFLQLARSVLQAQTPLMVSSSLINKMWTTMANTARWMISSSVLQGVTSTFSTAFNYAKDLNESLNNIRIVTGQSVEQMERFADKANKAAKALNTSTTAYTDAALIYYQQGLNDKEVEKRTNTTIKLANVAHESAATVSEWMTSIWNNFDNGTKSLEYYADVLTALGAATASSADEIAGGLEKFAAIADTVGLSYEYAASALATITAQTRQSEDVVGTSLKTVFARIQDLELGKTTEDGTTLGQYSQALQQIGISILDTNGNLKDMDLILNEMGAKWETLSKAQQTATAQAVAGVRQYSQLVALMDNWDQFNRNAQLASTAEGSLNAQAEIYAESWEASSKRVKAAAENLYSSLINDDFFITLNDGTSQLLTGLGEVIESMGGIKGLLPLLVSGLLGLFGPKMLTMVRNFSDQLSLTGKKGLEAAMAFKQEMIDTAGNSSFTKSTAESQARYDGFTAENNLRNIALGAERELTQLEEEQLTTAISTLNILEEQAVAAGKKVDEATRYTEELKTQQRLLDAQKINLQSAIGQNYKVKDGVKTDDVFAKIDQYAASGLAPTNKALKQLVANFDVSGVEASELQQHIKRLIEIQRELIGVTERVNEAKKKGTKADKNYAAAIRNLNAAASNSKESLEELGKLRFGDQFMRGVQGVSSLTFALSSLTSAVDLTLDAIKNDTFSFQDFLNILMSVTMALPMIVSGFKALSGAIGVNTINLGANTGAEIVNKVVKGAHAKATDETEKESEERSEALRLEKKRLHELNKEELKNLGLKKLNKTTYRGGGKNFDYRQTVGNVQKQGGAYQYNGKPLQNAGHNVKVGGANIKDTLSQKWTNFKGGAANIITTAGPSLAVAAVAIGAIVGGLVVMNNAINKNEKALKSATKNAEAAKKQYESITNTVKEFQDKAKGYQETIDSLSQLTKGTLEYKKALLEANQQAIDLINSSKSLQQPGSFQMVDGQIIIDNKALEKAEEEKLDQQTQAFLSLQNAEQIRREAQQTRSEEKLLRETKDGANDYNEGALGGVIGGVGAATAGLVGLGIANVWNPVGWAALIAGGAVAAGSAIYGATVGSAEENEKDALADLQEQFGEAGGVTEKDLEQFFENNPQYQGLQESFLENIDDINELIRSNESLRLQNEMLEQTIADSIEDKYADKFNYDDRISGGVSEIIKQAREDKEDETDDLYEKIKGQDGLLQDMYKFLHEGASLDGMAGTNIKIVNADGSTTEAQQATVAQQMAKDIAVAVQTGDATYISELKGVVDKASGVNDDNKKKIKELIDSLVIDAETEAKISNLQKQLGYLDNTASFSGLGNSDAAKNVITQLAKDDYDEIDFSALTREQIEELQYIKSQFPVEIQQKIETGIATYETRRQQNDLKTSIAYNVETDFQDRLTKAGTKAGINATELIAYQETISQTYGIAAESAEKVALANLTVKNGLTDVMTTFEKYGKSLDASKKGTLEYSRGIASLQTNFENWFGVKVDTTTIENNLENFKKALNGDKEAIIELQKVAAQEMIVKLDLDPYSSQQLQNLLAQFNQEEIVVGVSLDTSAAARQMANLYNDYILAGKMSSEEAVRILEAAGWDIATTVGTIVDDAAAYAGEQVEIIDLANSIYRGFESSLFDYMPEDIEKRKKEFEKKFKNLEREKELYTDINALIKEISHNLSEVEKKKERAFGKDKLKYIQQEKNYLEQSLKAQKKYLNQIEEAAKRRFQNVNNYGFSFSADTGRILNYDKVWDDMYARYKEGYAAAGGDDTLEKEQDEWWEDFQTNTNLYTTTIDLRFDTQEAITDLENQLQDNEYEEIEYTVEINVKVNDYALKHLDFQLKQIEDDAYAAAQAIDLLNQKTNASQGSFEANEQGLRDLLTKKGASPEAIEAFLKTGDTTGLEGLSFGEKDFELMEKYLDGMMDNYETMQEAFESMFDTVDAVFEKINEEFDNLNEILDHSASVLESYQNVIDLTGSSALGYDDSIILEIANRQQDVAQAAIDTSKAQYDKNAEMLAQAYEGLADAEARGSKAEVEQWKESIAFYEEQVRESEAAWLQAVENGLQRANDARNKAIDLATKNFLKETTGYGSMDELQRVYDQQKQLRDLYVQDYEKVYSLSKLSRQLEQSINNTSSISAKKQLLALEEKINKAKESGVKMSSYELSNLEREYQIELAKIALQEAQNAKSTVRLRRNSEGGMSYVYTTDQNALDEAQQKYEDAIYASQKANQEWLDSAQEGMLQATATYIEQMAVINQATYESEEERNQAIEALNDWYLEQQRFYTGQIDIVLQNNNDLYYNHVETMDGYYGDNESNFISMSQTLQAENLAFNSQFQTTFVGGLKQGCLDAASYYSGLVIAVGSGDAGSRSGYLGALATAQDKYIEASKKATSGYRDAMDNYLGTGTTSAGGKPGLAAILANVNKQIDILQSQQNFSAAQEAATTYASTVAGAMETLAGKISAVNAGLTTLTGLQLDGSGNIIISNPNGGVVDTEGPEGDDFPEPDSGSTYKASYYNPKTGKVETIGTGYATREEAEAAAKSHYQDWLLDNTSISNDPKILDSAYNSVISKEGNSASDFYAGDAGSWGVTLGNENYSLSNHEPKNKEFYRWKNLDEGINAYMGFQYTGKKNANGNYIFKKYQDGHAKGEIEIPMQDFLNNMVVDERIKIRDSSFSIRQRTGTDIKWDDGDNWTTTIKGGSTITFTPIDGNGNAFLLTAGEDKLTTYNPWRGTVDEGKMGGQVYNFSQFRSIFSDANMDVAQNTGVIDDLLKAVPGNNDSAKDAFWKKVYLYPDAFDTGGYTGTWGPEGRMAMLHQKEIVLNAHDTENILSVVDMVRQMATRLDFNALTMANGLGNLVANTMVATPQTVDQNVTITAEFPNATNREEIKEAFGDLVNLAAQYASRR